MDNNDNDNEINQEIENKECMTYTPEELIRDIQKTDPDYVPPSTNIIQFNEKPDAYKIVNEIKILNMQDVLLDTPPPIEYVFEPCLPTQGIGWIYAPTGLGKTFFSLNLAYAIASGGSFLKYKCQKPRRVLYVDGEMPYNQVHARLLQIADKQDEIYLHKNFLLLTPDKALPFIVPRIDEPYYQQIYIKILEKYEIEVIIFDNLSMLSDFDENKAHEFGPIDRWFRYLRSIGKTVIIVHHTGKGGDYRGTSKMLASADFAISLEPIKEDALESDAIEADKKFKVCYKKHRHFWGKDALPFEVSLSNGKWSHRSMEQTEMDRVIELVGMKMSQRDIAKELICSQSKVHKLTKKARSLGLIRD